jgi:hypothetical protein
MNNGDTSGGSSEEFFPISAIEKLAVEDPNIAWALEDIEEQIQEEKEMQWCPNAEKPNHNNDSTVFECRLLISFPDVWQMFKHR